MFLGHSGLGVNMTRHNFMLVLGHGEPRVNAVCPGHNGLCDVGYISWLVGCIVVIRASIFILQHLRWMLTLPTRYTQLNFYTLLLSLLLGNTPCSEKSNIFSFTIYFSQFLGKFYETFSEYP